MKVANLEWVRLPMTGRALRVYVSAAFGTGTSFTISVSDEVMDGPNPLGFIKNAILGRLEEIEMARQREDARIAAQKAILAVLLKDFEC
jgi:hypothetical protein